MSDVQRGFLVELCGLPGSGKSHAARRIAALLQDGGAPGSGDVHMVVPPRRGLGPRLTQIVQAPHLSLSFYHLAMLLGPGKTRRMQGVGGYIHEALSVRCALAQQPLLLADEGLFHHVFSMAFGSRPVGRAQNLIAEIFHDYYGPLDHLMVHLDIDRETCIRQFVGRTASDSSFNSATTAETVALFREDETYEMLLSCYRQAVGRNIFTLRTQSDLAELVLRILSKTSQASA